VAGAAIISGSEASKVFQFVEAALDAVALAIERLVVPNPSLATAVRRDHGLHAGRLDRVADGIAVVGFVGDDRIALNAAQHRLGGAALMHLAAGQSEPQRPAEGIGQQMDLGGQSSSGTPQSLVRSPFLAAPLPVAACWWALTRVASSIRYSFFGSSMRAANTRSQTPDFAQRVKRLWTLLYLPYRSGNSSHCAPDRSPENAVDKQAIVLCGSTGIGLLARQHLCDTRPLSVIELVPLRHTMRSESVDSKRNESEPIPNGNPECRLNLGRRFRG
jgi:hypothetical protein